VGGTVGARCRGLRETQTSAATAPGHSIRTVRRRNDTALRLAQVELVTARLGRLAGRHEEHDGGRELERVERGDEPAALVSFGEGLERSGVQFIPRPLPMRATPVADSPASGCTNAGTLRLSSHARGVRGAF
jgi:hypothetical protein